MLITIKNTVTQLLFYQKAPNLEKISALWKAEMKTDEMLFVHIALSFFPVLFSGAFFVVLSSVAVLFSAVPLSAVMWPQKLALLLQKPHLPCMAARHYPQAGLCFTLGQAEVLTAAPLFGILPPVRVTELFIGLPCCGTSVALTSNN